MSKKKRQTKKETSELNKKNIRSKYIKELATLDLENPTIFSSVVKNFFKDIFKIKYEVTLEELTEIATRKKLEPEVIGEITKLLAELSEFEFKTQSSDFDTSYFKFSFERILNLLTSGKDGVVIRKQKRLFGWLRKPLCIILKPFKRKQKEEETKDLPGLIELCKKQISEKDLDSATKSYLAAYEFYDKESEEVKEKYYDVLKAIREEITKK